MSETEDLIQELNSIRLAINESSEHTKRQLEAINTNFSIEAIISILAAVGITYVLQLSLYWIPSAFLLIVLWAIYSVTMLKRKNKKSLDQNLQDFSMVNPFNASVGFEFIIRNVMPAIKALSTLYVISIIIILATNPPWFSASNIFTYIPVATCLMFLSVPFLTQNLETFFSKENLLKYIEGAKSMHEFQKQPAIKILLSVIVIFLIVLYGILLVILPFVSLAMTYPSSIAFSVNIRWIILMLLLQIIAMIMIGRYFNALSAQKELTNTLKNYADLHLLIQYYLLNNQLEQKTVSLIKELFLTAKKFDVIVDDSMKICNFYTLIPNRANIREITFNDNHKNEKPTGFQEKA